MVGDNTHLVGRAEVLEVSYTVRTRREAWEHVAGDAPLVSAIPGWDGVSDPKIRVNVSACARELAAEQVRAA